MEVIEKRRSIRKYKDTPVEDGLIEKMIYSASLAPSESNTQPWHFIIIDEEDLKRRIVEVSHNQKWMLTAPMLIVCTADIQSRITETDGLVLDEDTPLPELKQIIRDTAFAVDHMILEAEALGLGTCWVGWYKQNDLRDVLDIPGDKYVVGVITLGYADESPKQRPRKNMRSLVHRNGW